ncbi:hypothetical protein [Brevibacillus porteri]|uniref:hypothetical protein n=1 Tax=Brevibacillus porteri TaxID=2126350 RepID=UPI003D248027
MMTTIVLCILIGMIFFSYHTTYVKATTVKLTLPSVSPLTLIHLTDLHGRTRFWNGDLHKLVNAYDPDIVKGLGTSRLPILLNCCPEITAYAINQS